MFHLFSSGYSDQLLTFSMDDVTGKISPFGHSPIRENASFAVVDNDLAATYFVHEVDNFEDSGGAISRWKFRQGSGFEPAAAEEEEVSSTGNGTCHITLMVQFSLLLVSNYHGQSFAAYSYDKDTGAIGKLVYRDEYQDQGSLEVPDRQSLSHPHGAYNYRDFIYVVDLGADKIWRYKVTLNPETNLPEVTKSGFTDTGKGSGPRHLEFDPSTNRAFLVTELDSRLVVYDVRPADGDLTQTETIPLYSEEFAKAVGESGEVQYPAEIALHPNRKWLYVSNRGLGAILMFDVSGDRVNRGQTVLTSGNWPRHFSIRPDGKFLVSALQLSNVLEVFKIDVVGDDGSLEKVDQVKSENSPAFVAFYTF